MGNQPNRKLVNARHRLNLSQAELAARIRTTGQDMGLNLACDEKRIGRWERGQVRWPSPAYRRVLCAVFNVGNVQQLGFVLPAEPARDEDHDRSVPCRAGQLGAGCGGGRRGGRGPWRIGAPAPRPNPTT